ncbi:MAG: methyltransferase domain-containing protein [Dehalococcoidia bacterium]
MSEFQYSKSRKYTDYDTIFEQCSGPGGLQLAEFMAEKMRLVPGTKLLDVGSNRGYQTCFLAREYGVFAVGIDPWGDRMDGYPIIEHLRKNAEKWSVEDSVLAIKVGVPETNFACDSFDYVYSTTALEMVRVAQGIEGYSKCLKEIYRVLNPGGIFGLGEPMHLDVELPSDLEPYVSQEEYPWKECFRSLRETTGLVRSAGFEIIEAEYAPDARQWWIAYAMHDPFCKEDPEGDPKTLEIDGGRWTSFGYIISKKPILDG